MHCPFLLQSPFPGHLTGAVSTGLTTGLVTTGLVSTGLTTGLVSTGLVSTGLVTTGVLLAFVVNELPSAKPPFPLVLHISPVNPL